MTQAQYYGGNFLLALPGMEDMRFDHSVVALCVHDGDGALGITVGEEMDGLGLRELLGSFDIDGSKVPDTPVLRGGPVEPRRGFVLHSLDWAGQDMVQVNQQWGLSGSLDILKAIAQRMRAGSMANAFPARLGGDEFALLVTRPRDCADLGNYVQQVLDQLQVSITQDGQTRRVSATVGATLADGPGVTQLDLMRRADLALYQAKRHMRGTGRIFGSDAPIIRDGVALS